MKPFIISLALLLLSFQLSGQNVIHYSYDSAGNRTQRDTTSTNVALLSPADMDVTLAANQVLPPTSTYGEDVISGGGTSAVPLARCQVLEKFARHRPGPWHDRRGRVCVKVQGRAPSRTVNRVTFADGRCTILWK